ncbi:MAG: hypothetical protein O2780_05555 [Proteobacteria bacterium]|jgi:hypothetical protein|nr:hypothetical protein [Pseudomonadota bacterium]MDA1302431.1 hypothetical protein [Pseudomonadota bacterium]
MATGLVCWNCGQPLDTIPLPISRHASCEACFEVIHCCRMCRHFRPKEHIQCDDERADPPVIKESANFCDYFLPAEGTYNDGEDRSAAAKNRLDALFDDAQDQIDDNFDARSKFDDLFDD